MLVLYTTVYVINIVDELDLFERRRLNALPGRCCSPYSQLVEPIHGLPSPKVRHPASLGKMAQGQATGNIMYKGWSAVISLCLSSLIYPAQAQVTGGALADICRDFRGDLTTESHRMCQIYVIGLLDGHWVGFVSGATLAAGIDGNEPTADYLVNETKAIWGFCAPDNVEDRNQYVRVIAKWLDEHPERHHEMASALIIEALQDAFGEPPCD